MAKDLGVVILNDNHMTKDPGVVILNDTPTRLEFGHQSHLDCLHFWCAQDSVNPLFKWVI